jgi:hypothetical protein
MESRAMFLNCPAYLDNDGALQCGLQTEVEARHIMNSTDGPLPTPAIPGAAPHGPIGGRRPGAVDEAD